MEQDPKVLVIDDDAGIRTTWKFERLRLGIKEVISYPSMEECLAANPKLDEIEYAFVDRNIGQSTWTLAQTITYLKQQGVKKVLVASGDAERVLASDTACQLADGIAREKIPASLELFK